MTPSLRTLILAGVFAAAASLHAADPEEVFTHPPLDAKPGVWWHWMGCNVSKEGITKDLEALHDAGFGMATIFGMADVCTPWAGNIENSPGDGLIAFTDPWWEMVRHAAAEGRRLGIDVGMHNCPGYTHSGGPWIPPELSMLELTTAKVAVEGGREVTVEVPRPQVDPHANMHFPLHNKDTGALEKPVLEARKTFYRDIALLALPAAGTVEPDQVVNLTGRLDASGRLTWTAPAGKWQIVRVGYTTMGSMTQPNQWEARGLECDKMNPEAMKFHLDHVIGEMKKHLGDLVGTGLRHVLFDSYEAGTPSWTPKMAGEFKARRGYDLTPFLATFAGRTIGGDAETQKFKGDFDRTIRDLYRDVHFAMTSKRFAEIGVRFACEPYGGPFDTAEAAPHLGRVMTEFWSGGDFRGSVNAAFFKGRTAPGTTSSRPRPSPAPPGSQRVGRAPGRPQARR
ncbi:MAG: glycosyl hydrolase [Kiritimatiellia bacterium]